MLKRILFLIVFLCMGLVSVPDSVPQNPAAEGADEPNLFHGVGIKDLRIDLRGFGEKLLGSADVRWFYVACEKLPGADLLFDSRCNILAKGPDKNLTLGVEGLDFEGFDERMRRKQNTVAGFMSSNPLESFVVKITFDVRDEAFPDKKYVNITFYGHQDFLFYSIYVFIGTRFPVSLDHKKLAFKVGAFFGLAGASTALALRWLIPRPSVNVVDDADLLRRWGVAPHDEVSQFFLMTLEQQEEFCIEKIKKSYKHDRSCAYEQAVDRLKEAQILAGATCPVCFEEFKKVVVDFPGYGEKEICFFWIFHFILEKDDASNSHCICCTCSEKMFCAEPIHYSHDNDKNITKFLKVLGCPVCRTKTIFSLDRSYWFAEYQKNIDYFMGLGIKEPPA